MPQYTSAQTNMQYLTPSADHTAQQYDLSINYRHAVTLSQDM